MGVDSGSQYAESRRRPLCGTEQVSVAQPGRFPASAGGSVRHAPAQRAPHAWRPQRGRQPDQELRHHGKHEGGSSAARFSTCSTIAQIWGINTGFTADNPGGTHLRQQQELRAAERMARSPHHPTGSPIQLLIRRLKTKKPRCLAQRGFFIGAAGRRGRVSGSRQTRAVRRQIA